MVIRRWRSSQQDNLVFGQTVQVKANETEQLWILDIGTPYMGRKRVTLAALGSDQQVRGSLTDNERPQLLVIDDCESHETSASTESQAKLDAWLMGDLLKATARNSVRIMLGNMINSRTMLYRLSKEQDWNPTVYGAIIRDKETGELRPLWEGFYTLSELIKEYAEYRKRGTGHIWVYEMMNMTMDSVFKSNMSDAVRVPRPNADQVTAGVITIDPAFGKNAWNDFTAIVVHVRISGLSIPIAVDSRCARYTETEMLTELVALSYMWNICTWAVESVAAQKLLIPLFKLLLAQMLIPPELFQIIPVPSGGVAKSSRILAFTKTVGAGEYAIADEETDLFESLVSYNPTSTNKDDLPDSAAYGPIAWAHAGAIVESGGMLQERLKLLQDGPTQESVPQVDYVPM